MRVLRVSAVLGSHVAPCLSLCCAAGIGLAMGLAPGKGKTQPQLGSVPGKEVFPSEDVNHRPLGGVL